MSLGRIRQISVYTQRTLNFLIGSRTELTLENRLFNSMSLIALVMLVFNIPFNYFSGLKVTSLIFAGISCIVGGLYYLARFRKQVTLSIAFSSFFVLTLFAINYFYAGGIQGGTFLSFTLAFMLIIIVSPKKLYPVWIVLSLLVAVGVLWCEYYHPEAIQVAYASRKARFIDVAFTYGTGIVVSFFSLFYVKEAYNQEKRSADQKTRELTRLNDEKLKLFSIISHDLQAPLSSLHSYVRLVAADRFNADERKMVERGLANALHGTQEMLSNMLVWSQNQLGGAHITLKPHTLHEVLMPVVDIQKIYANQKNITLDVRIDGTLKVMVDRDILQLVVRNLINNAIKFTPAQGAIHVSVSRAGSLCEIKVEDNGIGIPVEQQGSLFSLKTGSTYGTNNERGIGLGLFLCKEYMQLQHGSISFKSEVGKGTRFYLHLPLID